IRKEEISARPVDQEFLGSSWGLPKSLTLFRTALPIPYSSLRGLLRVEQRVLPRKLGEVCGLSRLVSRIPLPARSLISVQWSAFITMIMSTSMGLTQR